MRQIHEARNCAEQQIQNMAGDLREEFTRAICHEMEHVSSDIREEIRDEYTKLVTLSNQYHSHRYFGTVEDIKQIRENLQTLKQTIGMVDAELSDTKEVVEFLKDEVGQASNDIYDMKEDRREIKETLYREMDRDYRDMKSYVKRSIQKHRKQEHSTTPLPEPEQNATSDAIQMIVNEYDNHDNNAESSKTEQGQEREYENHHIIIIDANTVFSDDE
jgi:chromosome segregation ATPase